jgi:hypothetical protein
MRVKRLLRKGAIAAFASVSCAAIAGDIINGWSEAAGILEIRNFASFFDVKLSSSLAGCGTSGESASYWRVPVDASEFSKRKVAAIHAAYLAGKRVQLRCESSTVSDFTIVE